MPSGKKTARLRGCEKYLRPHPEERALARVSKDGRESMRCVHPFETLAPQAPPAITAKPLRGDGGRYSSQAPKRAVCFTSPCRPGRDFASAGRVSDLGSDPA